MRQSLTLYLVLLSTTRIGGETGLRSLELATLRGPDGEPYIPATSVKGVTRTTAYLAASMAGLRVCGARDPDEMLEKHRRLYGGARVCPVCGLWGAPNLESALYFTDMRPATPSSGATVTLPHLEIDDYTGRARRGALYVEEALVIGSVYRGLLLVDWRRVAERVERGLIGGVKDTCVLARLLLSSLLLLPLTSIGRGGIAAALVERSEAEKSLESIGCRDEWASRALDLLDYGERSSMRIDELLHDVFASIGERVDLARGMVG